MPAKRGIGATSSLVRFYGIALLVVALDQLGKLLALAYLPPHEPVAVLPGIFYLTLIKNTGIAFGLFREHPFLLFILISASLVILSLWILLPRERNPVLEKSLALVLGGAFGNWIDRIRFGAVIDFLDFRVWPVFNLADAAITIGVALYLGSLLAGRLRQGTPST